MPRAITESASATPVQVDISLKRFLITGLCFLCPLTDVKIADVQTVELFSVFSLLIALAVVYRNGAVIRSNQDVITLIRHYGTFLTATVILAIVSLRLPTFPLADASILKTAPFLSLSRCVQLSAAMGSMTLLLTSFNQRPSLLVLATQCYVYAGIIEAAYGFVSWLALLGHVELGGAYFVSFARAKGFFAEGGPFGIYLVSVILVCVFRHRVLKCSTRLTWLLQMAVLLLAFATASSKAGLLLSAILAVYFSLLSGKLRYVLLLAVLMTPLLFLSNIVEALGAYVIGYLNFDDLIQAKSDDVSFAMGRIMASVLIPIIVSHEPLLGIGFGNYSLERNNPEYLGNLPTTDQWDLPGLGLLGYAAEFGIPLLVYLCWIIWKPVRISRSTRASPGILVLASFQMFAQLIGVQITFVYPWVVTAIAVGYALTSQQHQDMQQSTRSTGCK